MVYELIQLIRLKHWVKNLFLFIPLFFAGQFLEYSLYLPLMLGFFSFGFVASSIYIINDIRDIESDRMHPKKKFRPLAAGSIKVSTGIYLSIALLAVGQFIAWYLEPKFAFVLTIYFLLNLGYTFGLKNISILDILIVASGFVFRIKAGAVISYLPLSQWIVIMVFLLALFIAIAKRRDDLVIKISSGLEVREASKKYNLDFLNTALSLISGVIIVAYLMYTLSPEVMQKMGTHRLFYTTLFVIAGLLRYLQLALVENNTGSPTELLYKDRFIQFSLFLWLMSFYLLLYFKDLVIFQR